MVYVTYKSIKETVSCGCTKIKTFIGKSVQISCDFKCYDMWHSVSNATLL